MSIFGIVVLAILVAVAIACIWSRTVNYFRSANKTRCMKGIKGFYPNLTRFVNDRYDRTQVLKDNNLSIETKSSDYQGNRNIFFRLFMNRISRKVNIKCVIKPNDKDAEQEEKDFVLDPTFGDERDYNYGEQKVMREMERWLKDAKTNFNNL